MRYGPGMSQLRMVLSALLGLVAVVLLPVALVAVWVDTLVADTDSYVETVSPVVDDPKIQRAVEEAVVAAVLSEVPLRKNDEATLRQVTQQVVTAPEFADAWAQANRSGHRQLVRVLSSDQTRPVAIPVAPAVHAVTDELARRGLDVRSQLPQMQASFELVAADDVAEAQQIYQLLETLGWWLPVGSAALAVGSLAVARRRAVALRWLGFGAALACGALLIALGLASTQLVESVASGPAQAAGEVVLDAVLSPLRHSAWWALAVGTVVGVIGLIPFPLRSRAAS